MGAVNPETRQRIDQAKVRVDKPYVVLVDNFLKIEHLCIIDFEPLRAFLRQCWPGPVTVILKVKPELQHIIGAGGTVAVRIPDHKGLQAVAGQLPWGLYSTSANISGQPVPSVIDEVDQNIKSACAYYIADEHITAQPSTIIDCSDNNFKVVREGLYPVATLRQLYNAALH
jgi:tRNA threonylcarbamoyl adenosine modification protein (Sua5/YciO/YrdC/YwlC family)